MTAQSDVQIEAEKRQRAYLEELHILFPGENDLPDDTNEWEKWLEETGELPPDFD